ncbi:MAG: CDP-alcohol phosphatidyltransferase family protein [Anaerolineales bacterium]
MIKGNLEKAEKPTLSDLLRQIFKQPLELVGRTLYRWGVTPNALTVIGFIGTCLGALFVAIGKLEIGGVLILMMGGFDALDGAVARAGGNSSTFGAFIDSVIDRFIEMVIYAGLVWYFLAVGENLGVILAVFALGGSVLVSYARARAQSLGAETKIGFLTRFERMVVIGPSILFRVPFWGVLIVAVFANITAVQRIVHVWQQMRETEELTRP